VIYEKPVKKVFHPAKKLGQKSPQSKIAGANFSGGASGFDL
jgi:hypothetical protein